MSPIDYTNDRVYFRADVEALFPDGESITFGSEDIRAVNSRAGDDLLIFQRENDPNHIIRLYLTTPVNDWRKNVTYAWKLSSAWMSTGRVGSDGSKQSTSNEWFYWNVENNIDSQILVYNPDSMFSCEAIKLHFRPLDRTPWKRSISDANLPANHIIMIDVLIGSHWNGTAPDKALVHRPCPDFTCQIIDGTVASSSFLQRAQEMLRTPVIWLGGLAFIVAVFFGICWISQCIQRVILKRRYEPVAANNDLDMKENGGKN